VVARNVGHGRGPHHPGACGSARRVGFDSMVAALAPSTQMFRLLHMRFILLTAGWLLATVASASTAAPPALAACDAGFEQVLQPLPAPRADGPSRAVWLNRGLIRWPGVAPEGRFRLVRAPTGGIVARVGERVQGAAESLKLQPSPVAAPEALLHGFKWLGDGVTLALTPAQQKRLPTWVRGQVWLVQEDRRGRVLAATGLQHAALLDDLFADAAQASTLGATVAPAGQPPRTAFSLWAPTAQAVWVCLHDDGHTPARDLLAMQRDARSGVWTAQLPRDLTGRSYTYLVDVFVPGAGLVRNRVTDPYATSLSADSRHGWIGRLDADALQPPGWPNGPRPGVLKRPTDLVVYELHVRDFSASDDSVSAPHRGRYLAFTETGSRGMQHLKALAAAGVTDVHLLPVFDIASVPEQGCTSPDAAALAALDADSEGQQALVMAGAAGDCFNWGYDPWHFGAPEGSYATDAADGAVRILEFRRMVQALHQAGLRVGMDLVYNHTSASGQQAHSVLDRIVPGYYHRLDERGQVTTSTCCANTATEHRMMARLMIDTAVTWARDYQIDSFRFDLMGHQPRAAMERLQTAVDAATGRHIALIGEGWNFGEVADGARFVQASQGSLNGTGIASFSDRGRDAARGGGCCDDAVQTVLRQGWLNGLFFDPNPEALAHAPARAEDLLRSADLVRVGLAGTLRDYRMTTFDGSVKALADIDYAGQGAGFASQPSEVVNYVENHDNQTLFDLGVLKLPPTTSREDRARVQVLGLALTAFSQGVAYFHAGVEALRSKSGDRNSFNSGDWFNRLDWTFTDNHWGSGLPPRPDNAAFWPALKGPLADPAVKPTAAEINFTRNAFVDLLRIRASSAAFRLDTTEQVSRRLTFFNTGPGQIATLVVGHLDARGLADGGFAELLYAVNAGKETATQVLPTLRGRRFVLHPVHRAADAADPRPAAGVTWDAASATLRVPARTAAVLVLD
jgi:pullulanase